MTTGGGNQWDPGDPPEIDGPKRRTPPTNPESATPLVDRIAQRIREVDGKHTLGAGALADALLPAIDAAIQQAVAGARKEWDAATEKYKWEPWTRDDGTPLICGLCGDEIPHADSGWHSDSEGKEVFHETCSYQDQIKKLSTSTDSLIETAIEQFLKTANISLKKYRHENSDSVLTQGLIDAIGIDLRIRIRALTPSSIRELAQRKG